MVLFRGIPALTAQLREVAPEAVKVLDPLRDSMEKLTNSKTGAVMVPQLTAVTARLDALESGAGTLVSNDIAGKTIGRENTNDDTGGASSATWVTVRTFRLSAVGTIAVRINAWMALIGPATEVTAAQARVIKNDGIAIGVATNLGNPDTGEVAWTDMGVIAGDIFKIQLKAGIQDDGGNFDADADIDWSEVRATVNYVDWS